MNIFLPWRSVVYILFFFLVFLQIRFILCRCILVFLSWWCMKGGWGGGGAQAASCLIVHLHWLAVLACLFGCLLVTLLNILLSPKRLRTDNNISRERSQNVSLICIMTTRMMKDEDNSTGGKIVIQAGTCSHVCRAVGDDLLGPFSTHPLEISWLVCWLSLFNVPFSSRCSGTYSF